MTKSYLEHLGITNVYTDGRIFIGDKEVKQYENGGYMRAGFYDPELYKVDNSGMILLSVHKIVVAWYVGVCPAGKVIHHVNGNKLDNSIGNLEILTQKENLAKTRTKIKVLPKTTKHDKDYYLMKLRKYTELYEDAKARGDQKEAHKQRANLSNTNARLRNFD